MLVGACSHPPTCGPSTMPSNRDSLLLLDPDLTSKLYSLTSSSYHNYVLLIFWIPGNEDQSSVSSAEATSDEEVDGGGATRGRKMGRGCGTHRKRSSRGHRCGAHGRGSSRGCETIEEGVVEVARSWNGKRFFKRKVCYINGVDVVHLVLCFA